MILYCNILLKTEILNQGVSLVFYVDGFISYLKSGNYGNHEWKSKKKCTLYPH